jgi:SAM-dependent methyltransferase
MSFSDPAFVEIYEQIDGGRTIDLEFYKRVARAATGPVLEAGCGSGRILLPLLGEGLEMSGFDPSQAMLDMLQARAERLGLKPDVWQGDFDSITGSYHAVISPFNSVMHLLEQEQQFAAFQRVFDALKPGGMFAFDLVNPYTLDIYDESRQFESSMIDAATDETIEIWRWFEHDPLPQLGKYHREFITRDKTFYSVIDFRWTYPSEIQLLLNLTGFQTCEVFGGFGGEPIMEDSSSQVWVATK